jgi:hypothetical protein
VSVSVTVVALVSVTAVSVVASSRAQATTPRASTIAIERRNIFFIESSFALF